MIVTTSYDMSGFPTMDAVIERAAGRTSDFSGCGLIDGGREHGWNCGSEIEAERISRALRKIGLRAEIRP